MIMPLDSAVLRDAVSWHASHKYLKEYGNLIVNAVYTTKQPKLPEEPAWTLDR